MPEQDADASEAHEAEEVFRMALMARDETDDRLLAQLKAAHPRACARRRGPRSVSCLPMSHYGHGPQKSPSWFAKWAGTALGLIQIVCRFPGFPGGTWQSETFCPFLPHGKSLQSGGSGWTSSFSEGTQSSWGSLTVKICSPNWFDMSTACLSPRSSIS